ncbi:MAG: TadE/TadG family type IV pilus assembly protein [Gemmatimonadota bacterium]
MNGETLAPSTRRGAIGERGQSLVEFAIALPILMAIVIGIFEFGMAWNQRQVITNAAREGARAGVIPNRPPQDVTNAINTYLTSAGLDPGIATIQTQNANNTGAFGQTVNVQLTYPYQFRFIGPIVAFLQGPDTAMQGQIQLQSTAVMRHE